MEINKAKCFVNELNRLCGIDDIYDYECRYKRNEEDELWEVMSNPVDIQMWSRLQSREKNYATSIADIHEKRYKGKDKEALEKYRLAGLRQISEETDPLKKIDIFYEYARELQESMKMLDFLEFVKIETKTMLSIEMCSNMFDVGKYTLTEIKDVMPWLRLGDIYGASKMLDKDLPITEEELEAVKAEYHKLGKPEVLKEMFGEPKNKSEDSIDAMSPHTPLYA